MRWTCTPEAEEEEEEDKEEIGMKGDGVGGAVHRRGGVNVKASLLAVNMMMMMITAETVVVLVVAV